MVPGRGAPAGGGSYQALSNEALRQHIGARRYQWEEAVRRVVREELARYGRDQEEKPGERR